MMRHFKEPHSNQTLEQARNSNIQLALQEDIGTGDLTAQLVQNRAMTASLWVRESAILCGRAWFEGCFLALDSSVQFHWHCAEGALMKENSLICQVEGSAHALLTGERAALNFLQTLSATATLTHHYVTCLSRVNLHTCAVLDTRKTIPGLRLAQKYAVVMGGGKNQRLALWDGILIKENHISAAGSIKSALTRAFLVAEAVLQQEHRTIGIQIEVENLDQLSQALIAGSPNILLDNFSIAQLEQAVSIRREYIRNHPDILIPLLEASGGVILGDLVHIAQTGIDRVSIGRITKDIKAIDFSLRLNT